MSSSVLAGQQWTDQALMAQMTVLNSILQNAHVDVKYMSGQCLLLSRILDSLVVFDWKPLWRGELLPLVRKVCKYRESPDARPALLVLLLSVKDAFRAEWLSSVQVMETDEIFTTLKWLFDSFTTGHDISGKTPMQLLQCGGSAAKDFQEASIYLVSLSNRFYPRLQVNTVFVAVHAKVGYEVLMCDFNVPHMNLQDRVRLFVGQKDKVETSTCIVTPPQVNILVNGHQVEKRVTTGYLDAGPQMPSDVTHLVKVGSNVLQAIGEFSGNLPSMLVTFRCYVLGAGSQMPSDVTHLVKVGSNVLQAIGEFSVSYVIAVASSRAIERSAKNSELQDYVVPANAASEVDPADVDDEVVEGASRVSLRCPISHQRLVVPVKATSCRHLQCFDYDTFLEINENRPAWRCPCCNSFISCPDLRIDRQMEKVLKGTGEKIYEVIINQDGSWVPVFTEDDETDLGPDVAMLEGGDRGSKYIDLSDIDDEPSITRQNSDVFQQHERKPDAQTLHAIAENRGNVSHSINSVVGQRDTARHPAINVPEFISVTSQISPSSSGHVLVGSFISEGMSVNVNGSGLHTTTSGNQVQNQPSPSIQSLSAGNHNFQVRFPGSRTASQLNSPAGPVNRIASSSGHITLTQLQPPQSGASPNIGLVLESGWIRQRQFGQQSPGTLQNVQDLGQMRPQWRSTGVPSPQLGTNTAYSQSLHSSQQVYSNQSQVSHSPRQQLSTGNLQQQRPSPGTILHHQYAGPGTSQQPSPSPGINSHHHQHAASLGTLHQQHSSPGVSHHQHSSLGNAQQQQRPSPGINSQQSLGINSQQRSGVWGAVTRGQWQSTNSTIYQAQAQALGGGAAVSEQSWRPAQRTRGSIANPSLGQVALGTSPSAAQQQRAPPVTAFPSTRGFNTATNTNSVPRFQMGMPVLNNQQAANVTLYNGTTWVSAPDFSSTPLPAPRFTGSDTSEGWPNFEDMDLPELPR